MAKWEKNLKEKKKSGQKKEQVFKGAADHGGGGWLLKGFHQESVWGGSLNVGADRGRGEAVEL